MISKTGEEGYILIPKKKKSQTKGQSLGRRARSLMLLRRIKENSNVPMLSWFKTSVQSQPVGRDIVTCGREHPCFPFCFQRQTNKQKDTHQKYSKHQRPAEKKKQGNIAERTPQYKRPLPFSLWSSCRIFKNGKALKEQKCLSQVQSVELVESKKVSAVKRLCLCVRSHMVGSTPFRCTARAIPQSHVDVARGRTRSGSCHFS